MYNGSSRMVDHCVQLLSKVLGNEKDAQMCLYHVSWQSKFGFCCDLDEQCAKELAGVPGVLDVVPDNSFESPNKDYEGVWMYNVVLQPPKQKKKRKNMNRCSFL